MFFPHGEHGSDDRQSARAGEPSGPVRSGSLDPKIATIGVPTAAARCIGPVSLVITKSQALSPAASTGSVVRPPRSTPRSPAPAATRAASTASSRPPKATTVPTSRPSKPARAVNLPSGQRRAGADE